MWDYVGTLHLGAPVSCFGIECMTIFYSKHFIHILIYIYIYVEACHMSFPALGFDRTAVMSQGPYATRARKSPFAPSGEGSFLRNW